jgi:PAS domain-containing protein
MARKPTYRQLERRIKELEKEAARRKRSDETLDSTYRKLRAIFDAIQENINVVDIDFNLTDVNDVLMKAFGLPDKESVLGRKCFEVLKGRKEICPNCAVAEVYRTKAPAYRTSTAEDEISTEGRSFEMFAYPIIDGDGKTTKEIAELFNVFIATVESHRKSIRRKIGISHRKANPRSHLLSMQDR